MGRRLREPLAVVAEQSKPSRRDETGVLAGPQSLAGDKAEEGGSFSLGYKSRDAAPVCIPSAKAPEGISPPSDLGLEGTFLSEVLYKNATFLNLVDPISHDLLMSLARDLQCPKKEYDPWKSSDRICRQLIYHLTPHSKWHRHGMPRRKSQACLKNNLQKKPSQDSMDLSGIPLTMRDVHRMAYYLQNNGDNLTSVDLSFTELNDEMVRMLLPFLWALPKLTHLSLNGNRLTRATMKELTDTMKDMNKFPCLAWVDLGNNVDVSSMPQPLLVGLRKRLSQQTTLPTIYESLDCDSELSSGHEGSQQEDEEEEGTEGIQPVGKDKATSRDFPQQCCER
uniref:Leucine rich repeat containing 75B n=1 Tax=Crocodylus porosus TaxID=8502 RepID=A0A7M4E1A3_CROPO